MSRQPLPRHGRPMTIGQLSARSGMPARQIRRYEGLGLIYTRGRSAAGYRLFDDSALWCIGVIRRLRGLGLTNREVAEIGRAYIDGPGEAFGPLLAERLTVVRRRVAARRAELDRLGRNLEAVERAVGAELVDGRPTAAWTGDPTKTSPRA